ncbi:MAG TPA: hypothetical protein DEP35_02745 [Deltaproteobacteria bacterium]|nr:hypothetical protein [Deltaproteobacteria bacterium]
MRLRPLLALLAGTLATALFATSSPADVPYPRCVAPACTNPYDYASYLFLPPGQLPSNFDPTSGDAWKYNPGTGMNIVGAWALSTGRPDVVVAILDSGILWSDPALRLKVRLNLGELPNPCPEKMPAFKPYDCNGDGVVNVDDFAGVGVPDYNHNGVLDAQDLIHFYSNGVDDDGNGYVDDIAGWNFDENNNDPVDDVDYGHGTGEAHDQVSEANFGTAFPGVSPSSMFVPVKVADSFVAVDTDFARAVVYATDLHVDLISEALGAVTASPTSQQAINYAYARGIPVIASAADEESRHHNYPANFEHTIWVNSIRNGDGTFVAQTNDYTILNGCTNYGGRAWVAISSASCSSEATGKAAGLTALLISYGKDLIDRGLLEPYPGLSAPFSAEEVRQIFRRSADDINQSADLALPLTGIGELINSLLSAPPRFVFSSQDFPTQAGWDEFTGFGRPDATRLLAISPDTIPPEADLSGSVEWFDTIDPKRTPKVEIVGSVAAERERVRTGRGFTWTLEVGCGVQPTSFTQIGSGSGKGKHERAVLGTLDPAATAAACGFDPAAPIQDPDADTVQLRLRVTDATGNLGEDRREIAIHSDPSLRFGPKHLGASGEASPVLADIDRDGVLDIVVGTAAGAVHVLHGKDGSELPGFPAYTDFNPVPDSGSSAYATGKLPAPREAITGAVAADDLDGDGRIEIVAASTEGKVYVFDDHGKRRPGFPVSSNPAFSNPSNRDSKNDSDPGFLSAPVLVNLEGGAGGKKLDIVVAGLDGHLYAWKPDGSEVPGFPVQLADLSQLDVDPATGKVTPKSGSSARNRLVKIVSSPAAADLDGDGFPELVIATNEEYAGYTEGFSSPSNLLALLQSGAAGVGGLSLDTAGRIYVVQHDGNLHPGGPFRPGWPVAIPLLAPGILPTVATGTPGSPAIADLDGTGNLAIAIFGAIGPVMLFDKDGNPLLGPDPKQHNSPRVLAVDFPNGGFPQVPPSAGSGDAPFFGALGSGAFGDITGDGLPEYVAPTGGLRKLLDLDVPGNQSYSDHSVTAWNPRTGELLPAYPRKMDDMQFLASPAIADVDGDGVPEVIQGSGAYLVHAFRGDGSEPAGWPKFTHGWMLGSPTPGDVDGSGMISVVASSREGNLFVWSTPAPAKASAIPWQGFGRDRRHTKNLSSGVPTTAATPGRFANLIWTLESIDQELAQRIPGLREERAEFLRSQLSSLVRFALRLFRDGQDEAAVALLRSIEMALRMPPLGEATGDLDDQLTLAVGSTVDRGVPQIACGGADARCQHARERAQDLVADGDALAARGLLDDAFRPWLHALFVLASH